MVGAPSGSFHSGLAAETIVHSTESAPQANILVGFSLNVRVEVF